MSKILDSSIEFDKYCNLWKSWCLDQYRESGDLFHQRWGQALCNEFDITEEQAPGLYFAETVKESNEIFNHYFNLH